MSQSATRSNRQNWVELRRNRGVPVSFDPGRGTAMDASITATGSRRCRTEKGNRPGAARFEGQAIPKKKLLMILGAGSSMPEGMPSVDSLDKVIRAWSAEWSAEHRLPNYFESVWEAIETYYERASPSIRPRPNFEKVLGDMIGLSHWMTPSPLGNALREIIAPTTEPLGPMFPRGPYGATVAVNDQLTYLLIRLARHVRGLCRSTDLTGQSTFQRYKRLLDGLRETFDVGIYNLNYDTVALTAWPEGFTGFAPKGVFDAKAVHRRSEWGFIYHLHGSVHHSLVGMFGDAIRWEANLASEFFDGHQGLATDHRSDNRSFPKTR
jgi:hypothetical protein